MGGDPLASSLGLFEFLTEAELEQYFNGFRDFLKIKNTKQLKYVSKRDLAQLGMSCPEQRRYKKCYGKYFGNRYLYRFKKIFNPAQNYNSMPSNLVLEKKLSNSTNTSGNPVKVASKHIIPIDSISINSELGVGEFGVVQQGTWTNDDNQRIQVAVKCLGRERMQSNSIEFLKEAAVMHSIDHPHVVRLYGVVLHMDSLMLITELAPLRSLLECLKEFSLRSSFPVITLCHFASQICDGMTYLENKRLIHRDLAARNILVFSKNEVKISDFGLSRALGVGKDYYQTNYNVNLKLPIAWCAPECITYLRFTSSSDVWAYAVTLWEMFSYGFQPWAAFSGQQILAAIDEPNFQRLEQPECCPDSFYKLMLECWSHEPTARPTFKEIATRLPYLYPEQLKATAPSPREYHQLEFSQGDIITVLKKNCSNGLWKGVLNCGRTGYFPPLFVIAQPGTMEKLLNHFGRNGHHISSTEDPTPGPSNETHFPSLEHSKKQHIKHFKTAQTAVVTPFRDISMEEVPLLNTGTSIAEPSSPPAYPTPAAGLSYGESANDPEDVNSHEYSEIKEESIFDNMSEAATATSNRHRVPFSFRTLTLGRKTPKPYIQPISPDEEKTLESAIAMTKEWTAKSMNELNHQKSPIHLTNERGKSRFRFPSLGHNEKEAAKGSHQRNFSEIANQVPDIQYFLTEAARVAYTSLIEKKQKKRKGSLEKNSQTDPSILQSQEELDLYLKEMFPTVGESRRKAVTEQEARSERETAEQEAAAEKVAADEWIFAAERAHSAQIKAITSAKRSAEKLVTEEKAAIRVVEEKAVAEEKPFLERKTAVELEALSGNPAPPLPPRNKMMHSEEPKKCHRRVNALPLERLNTPSPRVSRDHSPSITIRPLSPQPPRAYSPSGEHGAAMPYLVKQLSSMQVEDEAHCSRPRHQVSESQDSPVYENVVRRSAQRRVLPTSPSQPN